MQGRLVWPWSCKRPLAWLLEQAASDNAWFALLLFSLTVGILKYSITALYWKDLVWHTAQYDSCKIMHTNRCGFTNIFPLKNAKLMYKWWYWSCKLEAQMRIQIYRYKSLCIYLCIVFHELRNLKFVCEYFWDWETSRLATHSALQNVTNSSVTVALFVCICYFYWHAQWLADWANSPATIQNHIWRVAGVRIKMFIFMARSMDNAWCPQM